MIGRRRFINRSIGVTAALSLPGCLSVGLAGNVIRNVSDPTSLSASQLSMAIKHRVLSCEEVMQAYLARIHQYNPTFNAIVSLQSDDFLMQNARAADEALERGEYWGWLHGMPHAVKDLLDVKGIQSSYGSLLFAGNIPVRDSLPVARIREQGAIFVGRTNVPEFGLGSHTYNQLHGTTYNAYDKLLTAGGSSGGAASALALSLLPCADGSDMMGSLRNPAAFNNVVGFRPSQGRVPNPSANGGLFYHQLATEGPMGRTVEDTIRVLHTMSGYDPRAPLSARDSLPGYSQFHAAELSRVKIGWMADYEGYLPMEAGVLALCEDVLKLLAAHGADVDKCLPNYDMASLWEVWLTFRHWSMSSLKPFYDEPKFKSMLNPQAVWEIEGGVDMSAHRLSSAAKGRSAWYVALQHLFEQFDVLALPSAQVFPFLATTNWPASINGHPMDTYHRWMEVSIGGTLSGLPVISLPVGFDNAGRPMGIQFIGRPGEDKALLEFALAYEATTPFLNRKPGDS